MHVRILPQVDAGEVEAENADGAAQPFQPPAGKLGGAVDDQRTMERAQIVEKGCRRGIRLRRRRAPLRLRHAELAHGRGETRIETRDRAAIRLLLTMRGAVGRALREPFHLVGYVDKATVERQLGAERVQLLEIEAERPLALHAQGLAQRLRRDGLPSRSPPIQLPMRKKDGISTPFHTGSAAASAFSNRS